ncbi:MAG: asparagine synthase C-terminal domain-containing protein [Candidatus Altiarchaeota archaeon]|nr:asparagine synthase C-terminal domain-containing protein [Candidatus Altiarchaeota archaeon]
MAYIDELRGLLGNAVKETCDLETGVVFSGGIDSVIIAMLAARFSRVTAYSCGIKDSPDLEYVNRCEGLGFEVRVIEISPEEIEQSLAEIIHAINDVNPVKVSVEIPFYFASKKAGEDGLSVMLSGQGGDELFGGYNRYLSPLPDYSVVEEMMTRDVESIYVDQINKDIAVCRINDITLCAPYLDEGFKDYALKIPVESKLHEVRNSPEFSCVDTVNDRRFIRKYILRELGREIGVPEFILNRKKKAVQYGSGTWKILDKIARGRGFKVKAKKAGRTDYVGMFLEGIH